MMEEFEVHLEETVDLFSGMVFEVRLGGSVVVASFHVFLHRVVVIVRLYFRHSGRRYGLTRTR